MAAASVAICSGFLPSSRVDISWRPQRGETQSGPRASVSMASWDGRIPHHSGCAATGPGRRSRTSGWRGPPRARSRVSAQAAVARRSPPSGAAAGGHFSAGRAGPSRPRAGIWCTTRACSGQPTGSAPSSARWCPCPPPSPPAPAPCGTNRGGRIPWAELLRRVFAADVLACPCGGRRRVIAIVVDSARPRACSRRSACRAPRRPSRRRGPRRGPNSGSTTRCSPKVADMLGPEQVCAEVAPT
jgi:hypothetical protein